ncbi:EGF-like, conserved site-containing protein [Cynara cardunculus var. scolymus]|uniref:EGF-like, conserved site-containing protein n=1 Tax=Cynara cardunculus var. scolymus TaxID=59895 RepID=A0A103XE58_CYNCS|nr:EGF-like, conserved site-containing protein [Cynara cardunculus var. scolymus]
MRISSDTKLHHEIYALYGGLPFEDKWDYFYVNSTSNSKGSMFFKLYNSDEKNVGFYIVYAKEGTWNFGIKYLTSSPKSQSQSQTTMSISVERCPRSCSSHGTCQNVVEMSGLSLYSYCWCDRTHGGFDCSDELFMDFWLSFMAVVSTFVYLAAIDEPSKRTIHTIVAILTALMAETGATRRFRWFFVLAGFIALAMAAISWSLESTESYWFWHSMWHVSIYTSSFFFICSKVNVINSEEQGSTNTEYQLTRQDSLSRSEDRLTHV